jgi:hypothetical protein
MFKVKEDEMGRVCSINREKRIAYRILVVNPEGKRPRRRWYDNIKIGPRKIELDGMDWIDLAEDMDMWRALVNTSMNLRVP